MTLSRCSPDRAGGATARLLAERYRDLQREGCWPTAGSSIALPAALRDNGEGLVASTLPWSDPSPTPPC
jgi:hypothetical protein